jgi:hypothetical protein
MNKLVQAVAITFALYLIMGVTTPRSIRLLSSDSNSQAIAHVPLSLLGLWIK